MSDDVGSTARDAGRARCIGTYRRGAARGGGSTGQDAI